MTDEQIEKGLECCSNDWSQCMQCPYYDIERCQQAISKDALAYINRLKAEKAVSDRALELALIEIHKMLPVATGPTSILVPKYQSKEFVKIGVQAFKEQAKQELEKESKDETPN